MSCPAWSFIKPDYPYPVRRAYISWLFILKQVSGPKPSFSNVPGPYFINFNY